MNKFTKYETGIDGLYVIEPTVFQDDRGYFLEAYNAEDFKALGLNTVFVQDNQSKSSKGVLRGLHYQTKHPQAKLIRVVRGEVYDVAVDLRPGSKTYRRYHAVLLSAENKKQFFIPRGLAHGFLVLSNTAELLYKCDDFYHPSDEAGIIWNDPDLNIDWPFTDNIIQSGKDRNWPTLAERDAKNA